MHMEPSNQEFYEVTNFESSKLLQHLAKTHCENLQLEAYYDQHPRVFISFVVDCKEQYVQI